MIRAVLFLLGLALVAAVITPLPHPSRWPAIDPGELDLRETPLLKMLPRRRRLRIYRARQRAPRAVRGFHAFGYRPRARKVEWSDERLAP